jgi:site-specific DNA-methyltransferase (adenine-specific)
MNYTLHTGDCLEVMRGMAANSVDAIVTDPPYGLAFMGQKWDYDVPQVDVWREALRVLKPGGHMLCFAGTRTQHRMAVNIEDAGFEIRDMIAWVYGSGFPKSHDISKAIDREAGAVREVAKQTLNGDLVDSERDVDVKRTTGIGTGKGATPIMSDTKNVFITTPATPAAQQWQGWGTALKPALEPVTLARKPFKGTVAANVLEWGTGAINVDGCRVEMDGESIIRRATENGKLTNAHMEMRPWMKRRIESGEPLKQNFENTTGRFPANLIHDGSDEVIALMGDMARFFYCAKASKADRDEGLEGMALQECGTYAQDEWSRQNMGGFAQLRRNHHTTVKPTDLMRYLCRLITPPHGVILDPFMGSGSTGKAAMLEGFGFIGIELNPDYVDMARRRIDAVTRQGMLDLTQGAVNLAPENDVD